MLKTLFNAPAYWFDKNEPISWIKEAWTQWLWIAVLALAALFLLIIIVLFFKAIKRSRERRVEKRIQKEVAKVTKEDKKAQKEEEKRQKKEKKQKKEKEEEQQPAAVVAEAEAQPVERVLTGITLDVGVVQRDFTVDDEFNCDGLLVNATFNLSPLQETFANVTVVDQGTFDMAVNGNISGIYVCQPDLSRKGKTTVRVCFNKHLALYTISVNEKPQEAPKKEEKQPEPQPVAVMAAAAPQQDTGKREMISLTVNTDYVRRDFYTGDTLVYDGLIVNAHYNREPFKEQVYNYTVVAPDMSRAGNPNVVVMFQDRAASYPITVRQNPYPQQQQYQQPQQQQYQPYAQQQYAAQPQQQAQPQKERVLTYVSINSDFAKKDYTVGEQFSREGLMVMAHYNVEPLQEQITNFTVIPPDMNREGMATVMVAYQDRMLSYQINVRPAPVAPKAEPTPAPIVEQPKAERELMSVTLDTGVVQREFEVGEAFNCDGLLVNGNYSMAPTLETYADFNIVDATTFDQVSRATALGVYVCRPDMSVAGKKVVRVCLNKHIALYTISVKNAEKKTELEVEDESEPEQQIAVAAATEEPAKPERVLTSVTLDLGVVQREFEAGEEFNCDGLLVNGNYSSAPTQETFTEYTVIDAVSFEQIQHSDAAGVFVCEPDTTTVGKKVVRVSLNKRIALYTVSVRAAAKKEEPKQEEVKPEPIVEPVVVEEPKKVERVLESISLDTSVVQRDFDQGDKFNCDGLLVNLHYNVEPTLEAHADYTVVDSKTFDMITNQAKPVGCYVCRPNMNETGEQVVKVSLNKQMALYTIVIQEVIQTREPEQEEVKPEPVIAPVIVEEPKKVERVMEGISLDTEVVQREFELGDRFNCDGLLVNVHFNVEPELETHADYTVVDAKTFDQIINQAKAVGCYVCRPNMYEAGEQIVKVSYNKQMALYVITVNEAQPEPQPEPQPQPEPEPVVVEKVVEKIVEVPAQTERRMLYITLATDEVKKVYTVGESFSHENLLVRAHHNTEPYMEIVDDYTVTAPDMNQLGKSYVGVHYRDKSAGYQITVKQPEPEQEEVKPEVKPVVVEQAAPIVVEEESYEGRLRYDRSFQARIIQSDDKTKYWYTDVKNELLSYKKVHGRISWKRETFKCGKAVVAKLAYRGNTLCLLLPLKAADYEGTQYALEDVSNTPSNVDTPAMLRLKSDKRVKQAMELIEEVMSDLSIDKDKKYQPEDFYVPYEGVFELIKKGLIKREIKTAADESVFTGGSRDEEGDDDAYELEEVAPGVYVSPKK